MVCRLIFALVLLYSLSAHAGDVRLKAVSFEFPPYEYLDRNNQVNGLAVDLVKELCKRLGSEITIEILPWARSLKSVQMGQADLIFTAYYTDERATFLDYVDEVLIQQEVSLFTNIYSDFYDVNDVLSRDDVTLGIRRKISYGNIVDGLIQNGKFNDIWKASDDVHLLRLLARQRVDVIPLNRLVGKTLIRQQNLQGLIREVTPIVQSVPSFIAFSKKSKHAGLAKKWAEEIRKMKADGTYNKIYQRWSS